PNADGSATATSSSLIVTLPPGRVVISALSESHTSFAAGGRGRKLGTVFSFRLSRPAEVRIAIERLTPGHRVAHRCRPLSIGPSRSPRCLRAVRIGVLIEHGHRGRNRVAV